MRRQGLWTAADDAVVIPALWAERVRQPLVLLPGAAMAGSPVMRRRRCRLVRLIAMVADLAGRIADLERRVGDLVQSRPRIIAYPIQSGDRT
jgi:hypothetical protein